MSNKLVDFYKIEQKMDFLGINHENTDKKTYSIIEKSLMNDFSQFYVTPNACIDITETKGESHKFITSYPTDKSILINTNEVYKKDYKGHKAGEFKQKKIKIFEPLYVDIVDVLMSVSEMYPNYKQVCAGTNHTNRQIMIVDVDANKYKGNWNYETNKPYGYLTSDEAKKDVDSFISKYNLPNIDYFIYNKESGNIQFGWFIKTIKYSQKYYPEQTRDYLDVKDALAFMWGEFIGFPGDKNFKGWQIKNPFSKNKDLECQVYFDTKNRERPTTYLTNFEKIKKSSKDYIGAFERIKKEEKKNKVKTIKSKKTVKETNNINNSRNYYELKEFPKKIWDYKRTHNGDNPSQTWVINTFNEIEDYACYMTGKPDDKSEKEKRAIRESILRWSIRNYKEPKNNESFYTKEQKENARIVNTVKKLSNYLTFLEITENKKLSLREVEKLSGLSRSTVQRYSKMSLSEKIKMMKTYKKFFEKTINFTLLANSNEIEKNKYINLLNSIILKIDILHEKDNKKIKELMKYVNRKYKKSKEKINYYQNNKQKTYLSYYKEMGHYKNQISELAKIALKSEKKAIQKSFDRVFKENLNISIDIEGVNNGNIGLHIR